MQINSLVWKALEKADGENAGPCLYPLPRYATGILPNTRRVSFVESLVALFYIGQVDGSPSYQTYRLDLISKPASISR
jgi:hypothetical protein